MSLLKAFFILLVVAVLVASCSGTRLVRIEKQLDDSPKWAAASRSAKAFAPPSVN